MMTYLTAVRRMSDIPFTNCEVFHPVMLNTGIPAGMPIDMTKVKVKAKLSLCLTN
jgi:hypothetical protein